MHRLPHTLRPFLNRSPARHLAGHSHYHNTRHRKATMDRRREIHLQKLSRAIYIAISRGGHDPSTNPHLAQAIHLARRGGLPKLRISNALVPQPKTHIEPATFEAMLPQRVALLIRAAPSHRVASALRAALRPVGGKLDRSAWLFHERLAVILCTDHDKDNDKGDNNNQKQISTVNVELATDIAIENGVTDIELDHDDNRTIVFICPHPRVMQTVRAALVDAFATGGDDVTVFAERVMAPLQVIDVDDDMKSNLQKILDTLDAVPDIYEVVHNVNI